MASDYDPRAEVQRLWDHPHESLDVYLDGVVAALRDARKEGADESAKELTGLAAENAALWLGFEHWSCGDKVAHGEIEPRTRAMLVLLNEAAPASEVGHRHPSDSCERCYRLRLAVLSVLGCATSAAILEAQETSGDAEKGGS